MKGKIAFKMFQIYYNVIIYYRYLNKVVINQSYTIVYQQCDIS